MSFFFCVEKSGLWHFKPSSGQRKSTVVGMKKKKSGEEKRTKVTLESINGWK